MILDWDRAPAEQMALDEAHLLGLGPQGPLDRVLRFTTWSPVGTSLGYFQKLEAFGELPPGPVVRRQTGGGAIHHAGELTFTFAAPETDALYRGPVAESYDRVHALLAAALLDLGVPAEPRGERELASEHAGTGMCFAKSSRFDLVWPNPSGRLAKGVGSAQRRRGGRVLHHGSIKILVDPYEPDVALVPGETQAVLNAWLPHLAQAGVSYETSPLTDAERTHARDRAEHFLER